MPIEINSTGSFSKTEAFLLRMSRGDLFRTLKQQGEIGIRALAANTPVDSGDTAASWGFEFKQTSGGVTLTWTNSNLEDGVPIAIILQYGHGTGTGGYVKGRDYINPAMKPIFDKISADVWKAVTSA